jgi:short-subunit dehydrogenase
VPVLANQTIVVTGASGGIGKAIAYRLADAGATVCLCGRDRNKLDEVSKQLPQERSHSYTADLRIGEQLRAMVEAIIADNARIDGVIHCAAIIALGAVATASIEDFEDQFEVNVLAPFHMTQLLLPHLIKTHGQVIFVNSSAGLTARANVSQYAATKHALKALADSLRQECNASSVRVSSLFLGDTATPMQANVRKQQERAYDPKQLIQPEDVAAMTLAILSLSRTAEVTDVMVRPMQKT